MSRNHNISAVLQDAGLSMFTAAFEAEKITPDIVCKLSNYEFQCLGVTDRSAMMKLRTDCLMYGPHVPQTLPGTSLFVISKERIESLLESGLSVLDISSMMSVSQSTVYRRMRQFNITQHNFTDIEDEQLDTVMREITQQFPHSGETMIRHILAGQHIKVQRSRIRDSLHRIDSIGISERRRRRLHRRVYNVPGANHLWHIDTNHKLIRWHFIIVGGIDGFSRLAVFLECKDNNKADTILSCFLQGVQEFGLPLRVRSDKGLENSKVADFMITWRGSGQGSMITGKSTHNQRIERLWRDVYEGVLGYFYDLFYFLEDDGILDMLDNLDIYALHHVYLEKINEKLSMWKNAWARHRLRTAGSSPLRLHSAGMMNNPTPPSLIDIESYGVDGTVPVAADAPDDNPRPTFMTPTVPVDQNCLNELNEHCPRNWFSNNHGIDIYRNARQIIRSYN